MSKRASPTRLRSPPERVPNFLSKSGRDRSSNNSDGYNSSSSLSPWDRPRGPRTTPNYRITFIRSDSTVCGERHSRIRKQPHWPRRDSNTGRGRRTDERCLDVDVELKSNLERHKTTPYFNLSKVLKNDPIGHSERNV